MGIRLFRLWNGTRCATILMIFGVSLLVHPLNSRDSWALVLGCLAVLALNYSLPRLTDNPLGTYLALLLQSLIVLFLGLVKCQPTWLLFLYFLIAAQGFFLLPTVPAWGISAIAYLLFLLNLLCDRGRVSAVYDIAGDAVSVIAGFLLVGVISTLVIRQSEEKEKMAQLMRELEESSKQLSEANTRLQEYIATVEILSRESERSRLAREIHDGLGNNLATLLIQLEACSRVMPSDVTRARQILEKSKNLARDGLRDVRRSIRALSPVELDDHMLSEAMGVLCHELEQTFGIEITLRTSGKEPSFLPETERSVLIRVLQEAVNNAYKHGKATRVDVFLAFLANTIELQITDNGSGATEFKEGFGLKGIRMRVESLGGRVTFRASPKGFSVYAVIPYDRVQGAVSVG